MPYSRSKARRRSQAASSQASTLVVHPVTSFICPLDPNQQLMRHPIRASNGKVYEALTLSIRMLHYGGIIEGSRITSATFDTALAQQIDEAARHSPVARHDDYVLQDCLEEMQQICHQQQENATITDPLATLLVDLEKLVTDEMTCSITGEVFCFPAVLSDSSVVEARELLTWLQQRQRERRPLISPETGREITSITFDARLWKTINELNAILGHKRYPLEQYPDGNPKAVMQALSDLMITNNQPAPTVEQARPVATVERRDNIFTPGVTVAAWLYFLAYVALTCYRMNELFLGFKARSELAEGRASENLLSSRQEADYLGSIGFGGLCVTTMFFFVAIFDSTHRHLAPVARAVDRFCNHGFFRLGPDNNANDAQPPHAGPTFGQE